MAAKIQKSSDLGEIWLPSRLWCSKLIRGFCILAAQPIWIQNGHHSKKKTMDINSQHHNLLGNQSSSKSEEFCILAAILAEMAPKYKIFRLGRNLDSK
jgi:hypothetical protein